MNYSTEEIEDSAKGRTAIGATGKRLAFNMPDAPFESELQAVASEDDRVRLEAEKAEVTRMVQEREQNAVVVLKKFRPKGDRVLVIPLVTPEKKNGVIIAESARYLTAEGKVIAVGPGVRRADGTVIPLETQVGDVVKYTPYTGSAFKLNDQDVLVLRESDLLGDIVDGD